MTRNKVVNAFLEIFAIVLLLAVIVGGVIYLVHIAIGELTPAGIHILATAEFFGVIGAFVLGLALSRWHRAGIKTGIEMKQTASTPRPKRDDWRPKVDVQPQPTIHRTTIVQRRSDSGDRLDL